MLQVSGKIEKIDSSLIVKFISIFTKIKIILKLRNEKLIKVYYL